MRKLLLPHDAAQVFLGYGQQALKLAHAVLADVAGCVGGPRPFKEAGRLFVVFLGHIQGVFEGGFVLRGVFVSHATSVVPFPG